MSYPVGMSKFKHMWSQFFYYVAVFVKRELGHVEGYRRRVFSGASPARISVDLRLTVSLWSSESESFWSSCSCARRRSDIFSVFFSGRIPRICAPFPHSMSTICTFTFYQTCLDGAKVRVRRNYAQRVCVQPSFLGPSFFLPLSLNPISLPAPFHRASSSIHHHRDRPASIHHHRPRPPL